MTVRDIQAHLARTIGTELSHETISKITDAVLEEVKAWQTRPLDEIYPIMYLDALVVKVRDGHQVRNKAAHIAVGVDLDGVKHVLGIWVQATEGAKFWAGVCAELANRGVRDVLIVCCDGLTGFPEAIEATWPQTTVQTCVVHLIRAAMRFVSYKDRKAIAKALRPIYTAAWIPPTEPLSNHCSTRSATTPKQTEVTPTAPTPRTVPAPWTLRMFRTPRTLRTPRTVPAPWTLRMFRTPRTLRTPRTVPAPRRAWMPRSAPGPGLGCRGSTRSHG